MYDLGRYVTNQHANRKFQTVGNLSSNRFQVLKNKTKQNKLQCTKRWIRIYALKQDHKTQSQINGNPSTREAEAGTTQVQSQSGLHSSCQAA